jgi:hypothetical protein
MAIEPAEIPPHMLEAPNTRGQKKAFAKVKRAAKADASEKKSAKKTAAKTADSGYLTESGNKPKP